MADGPDVDDEIRQRIVRLVGDEAGGALMAQLMAEANVPELVSPESRSIFAAALIARGGVLEALGRSIRVQALLQGAGSAQRNRRG
jgi:hypothetical protein